MEEIIRKMLVALGEDPMRQGLEKTPARVAKAYGDLTSGYDVDTGALLEGALFEDSSTGAVVCRNIHFVSMCEHHLLPFFGRALIVYIPNGRLVGISKLVRLTQAFARRLQVQERMGQQILDAIQETLAPKGVLVQLEATHLCMVARGVRQQDARMETLHTNGVFQDNPALAGLYLK